MKPHKRMADVEDDVAAEGAARAQDAVAHPLSAVPAPSNLPAAAAAALPLPPPNVATAQMLMQSTAGQVASSMHGAPSSSTASSPFTTIAASSQSAATATAPAVQAPPAVLASFGRLADVEVQLIMQQLDQPDILRLARCSRALLRCASHPFVWQQFPFPVFVLGSEVRVDPRRARSLLRFAPSFVNLYLDRQGRRDAELQVLPDSDGVNCATLLRVPDMVALNFLDRYPIMQLDEWQQFLQHPSAQRLTGVDLRHQRALCDATSAPLLSQLPLLRILHLFVPDAPSASYFEPLAHIPSLTKLWLWGLTAVISQPPPLVTLAQCTRLQFLVLNDLTLRVGQLSELLIQLARAGGRLEELQLRRPRMLPMDGAAALARDAAREALSLELGLALPSLQYLHTLVITDVGSVALTYAPSLPSLRLLVIGAYVLPFANTLALLLLRLPSLHCAIDLAARVDVDINWKRDADVKAHIRQLMQQCPRAQLSFIDSVRTEGKSVEELVQEENE
jgi:hypothetical protein